MTHEELDRPLQAPVDYTDLVIVANLHCHLQHNDYFTQNLDWNNLASLHKLGLSREELLEKQSEMTDYQQQSINRFSGQDPQAGTDIPA